MVSENNLNMPDGYNPEVQAGIIESVAKIAACVRNMTLYGRFHPLVQELSGAARQALQRSLSINPTLVLMVADSEMILDNFPLVDITGCVKSFAEALWQRNIGELRFIVGITDDEIADFAEALSVSPQDISIRGGVAKELEARGVTHIIVGGSVLPEEFREGGDPADIYDEALMLIEEAMMAVQSGLQIPVPEIRAVVSDSLQSLIADESALLALTNIRSYDRYLSEHSVNVCILSMVLARDFGIETATTLELGVSAMLHDVGKVFVSKDVVGKPGKLTEEEWQQIRRHPAEGARALAGVPELPALASTVALEHHAYCDGTGYPALSVEHKPHLWSRLIAIVDTYDALTTDRPYRERWSAEQSIAWMLYEARTRYDRQLLSRFASRARLYAVGSIVRLESGKVAVVVGGNFRQPKQPKIRILEGRDDALIPGEVIDLSAASAPGLGVVSLAQPVEALLRYTDKIIAA